MNKISTVLAVTALFSALPAHSQDVDSFSLQREKLVLKYKNTKPLLISFYNTRNSVLEINLTANKYIPLANYLSDKMDRLVVFDVDTDSSKVTQDVLNASDLVFTSPLQFNNLADYGWKPLVVRNNNVNPVFIVRKNDSINGLSGLKDKKITSQKSTIVSKYAVYQLIKSGVYEDIKSSQKYFNETANPDLQSVLKNLEDKKIDAIVLTEKDAKKLVAGSEKFQLIKSGFSGPDLVVYYNSKNSDGSRYKPVFLSMTEDNLPAKEALVSAREFTPGERSQFVELSTKDAQLIKDVIALTEVK